jgi:hypothetical protein
VDFYKKTCKGELQAFVIATRPKHSFTPDTEGTLFTKPICGDVFDSFKLLKKNRVLVTVSQPIDRNMCVYIPMLLIKQMVM